MKQTTQKRPLNSLKCELICLWALSLLTACATSQSVTLLHYPEDTAAAENYRVALVMVDTVGREDSASATVFEGQLQHYSPEQLGEAYFIHPDGVASFIREASYNQVGLYGTVVGWYEVIGESFTAQEMVQDRNRFFRLSEDQLDFEDYDIFVLVGLTEEGGINLGWQMVNSIQLEDQLIENIGIDFMINSAFLTPAGNAYSDSLILPSTSWAHELIHTLGLVGHANSLWCGDETGHETLGVTCEQRSYGGVFNLMGENAYATHPDVGMKVRLGWLSTEQIFTIDLSEPFDAAELTIYPLELDDGREKGINILLPEPVEVAGIALDRMLIEYRSPIGFDRYLSRLDGPDAPDGGEFLGRYTSLPEIDSDGVLIYLDNISALGDTTYLLDMNPATPFNSERGIKWPGNPGKFADAMLPIGQTFDTSLLPFRVTPLALTEDGGIRVRIEMRPVPNS